MGVVYLARDPRLDRSVAIKVLPDALALDPDSLARFEREAKLLAALNHPNIAAIYGVEDADGQRLLVLEYVPGDTLAAHLARGAMPIGEALDVCRQIAQAMETAHEAGIIHRDLKPGNVKLTPEGQVKVLDFGLAKGGSSVSGADLAQSPTLTYSPTAVGVILGTAGYMSPEQARGKVVDRRTDIWAFGCVLFECLTGRQVFGGETVSDTIARILEREPDWSALPAATPARVRDLLRHCLEKDLKKRQRDMGDVRIEIEDALAARSTASGTVAGGVASRRSPVWRKLATAALLLVLGGAAGIGLWSAFGPSAGGSTGTLRMSVTIPSSIRATYVDLTRDGDRLIVSGFPILADGSQDRNKQLFTRPLDTYELTAVPGTSGVEDFWSAPDPDYVAVLVPVSEQSAQRRLVKVALAGGAPPVKLVDWENGWEGAVWLESGEIVILSDQGTKFFLLPTGGGAPGPPIPLDTQDAKGFPRIVSRLPGDRGVFLQIGGWDAKGYQEDVWLLDHRTGKAKRLLENAGEPVYVPTGHLVFSRGPTLMAVPFDLEKQTLSGSIVPLLGGLRANTWSHGGFGVRAGHLIYAPGGLLGADRELVTIDRTGAVTPFVAERRPYESSLASSRDGRKAAFVVPNARGTYETWIADADRPGLRRVLAQPNADSAEAVWSHNGQWLAFTRTARDKDDGIYVQRADGTAQAQKLAIVGSQEEALRADSWDADGTGVFVTKRVGGQADIIFAPIPSGGATVAPRAVRATPAVECCLRASPDGRYVAFVSEEAGQSDVYVAPLLPGPAIGPALQVTSGGAWWPVWSEDSRQLFFGQAPGRLMTAKIEATTPSLRVSTPVQVHDLRRLRIDLWDVLPNGRFLGIRRSVGEDDVTSAHVVLNWIDELRAKMGR
jgi:serine/threonine-protein kinase